MSGDGEGTSGILFRRINALARPVNQQMLVSVTPEQTRRFCMAEVKEEDRQLKKGSKKERKTKEKKMKIKEEEDDAEDTTEDTTVADMTTIEEFKAATEGGRYNVAVRPYGRKMLQVEVLSAGTRSFKNAVVVALNVNKPVSTKFVLADGTFVMQNAHQMKLENLWQLKNVTPRMKSATEPCFAVLCRIQGDDESVFFTFLSIDAVVSLVAYQALTKPALVDCLKKDTPPDPNPYRTVCE